MPFTSVAPDLRSGIKASTTFLPIAAAYLAGDIVGAAVPAVLPEFAFTFANGLAIPQSSLIRITKTVLKIDRTALISGETSYTLHLYSVTQPSAQADNAAWTLASGDLPSYLGSVSLGTPVDLGAALIVVTEGVNVDLALSTASVWGRIVTVGAQTMTAELLQVFLRGIVL